MGGSQGAKFFDLKIKDAILNLSKKYKLKVYQQSNSENHEALKNFYYSKNIDYQLFDYEEDVSEFISNYTYEKDIHLVNISMKSSFLYIPSLSHLWKCTQ